MKTIGGYEFPENEEEAELWKPAVHVAALAGTVLCVATTRIEGKWKAYCDSVPGKNHDEEWQKVKYDGCGLLPEVARAIFPVFKDIPYHN